MTQIGFDFRERHGWNALATGVAVVCLVVFAMACSGRGDKKSGVTAAEICAATEEPAVTIQSPEIIEASGIAASRLDNGVLWVHNDSGDSARFFAVDGSGKLLATFSLQGATATDWEDAAIAIPPKPVPGVPVSPGSRLQDIPYLYLADIGDNNAQRATITVYRVPEPSVGASNTHDNIALSQFDKLTLRYPDRAHDAETFMVDPVTGDFFIVTKELGTGVSLVFRAPASATSSAATTLEQVGQIDFKSLPMAATPGPDAPTLVRAVPFLPTGGDISPDGSLIAIRTYGAVWVWSRAEGQSIGEALAGTPCEAPSAIEPQGEAIAFDADGSGYVTTSEGANPTLHHFVIEP
jgi:hypothetical protein